MRFKERLLAEGVVSEDDCARIEADVTAIVEDALRFATTSPWPDPATVLDHVYST